MSMGVEHTQPTAHKHHQCAECGRLIFPGEAYHRFSGMWLDYGGEAKIEDHKVCRMCHVWGMIDLLRS